MKTFFLSTAAVCGLALVSCKDESGTQVPARAPSPDGSNTSYSGAPYPGQETPPSTRSGYKGTGAGVDAPDNPQQAKPPAVPQPVTGSDPSPNPPPVK